MSAQNSISQLLEQFLELNTNSLETFNRINEAIATDKETVTLDLYDPNSNELKSVQIPAFGYLKRELERLDANVKSITVIDGNSANVRLKDGSFRKIYSSRLKGPAPSIKSLAAPTQFNTKLNEFFEDFLNPLLTVRLDVSGQLPIETERVYVERYIFNSEDPTTVDLFDDRFKAQSDINYTDFISFITDNALNYYLDSNTVDMPVRDLQYYGGFDVVQINNVQKTVIVDGVSQTKTVKLFTLNKLTYSDSTRELKDTEALRVNDSLIVNSGAYRTRYIIKSIDNSTSQIELELIEGFEPINIGADQLAIYKDVETDLDIEINVGFNERQVIFVKPIDHVSNIVAEEYSPGVGFYSNELELVNATGQRTTLATYYRDEVADFGEFIKSLSVDYIPPSSSGIKPASPAINTDNLKVVQVNKHLTDNTTIQTVKKLKSDKIQAEQQIKSIDEAIKQKKALLSTKKFKSKTEFNNQRAELNSLIADRQSTSQLYASTVNQIKAAADSVGLTNVTPKFRVRGFWSIPEPRTVGDQVSQEVVQFKIRYRYQSTSGTTSEVQQIPYTDSTNGTSTTAAFSNWIEVNGPVRKRELVDGKYKWITESEEDAQAVNFNSLDLPISNGEVMEIMVKSVSEAGFPSNPLESDWSEIVRVEFPEGELATDSVLELVSSNQIDSVKVQLKSELQSEGFYDHIVDQFEVNGKTYVHNATSIASGFLTTEQSPISLYDKLLELQNEIASLRAQIDGTLGELEVTIIDEDGNVTKVTNNTRIKLFAGYYINELPATNYKGYIVTKNYKIELSNSKATDLELIARIIGDTELPAPVSSTRTAFGLGSGTIDADVLSNTYYTTEGNYDLVPLLYQNISTDEATNSWFNYSPNQSSQLKGQFVYSRFKNLANDNQLYIDSNIDTQVNNGYDIHEYGLNYTTSGVSTDGNGYKEFTNISVTPFSANGNVVTDFIWSGDTTDINSISTLADIGGDSVYNNGMYLHVNHPLLSSSNDLLDIWKHGAVGMPKTAPRNSVSSYGRQQMAFRLTKTIAERDINNDPIYGMRSTLKMSFDPNDQYLLGGHSCGSFLFLAPIDSTTLSVDAKNKYGKKIVPASGKNSISIDLVFQYRMTDYYGPGEEGTGLVGGVTSNLSNLTYAKKIGIDILDKAGNDFQFDVEVYAKYKPTGNNVNSITSSMVSNYISGGGSGAGYAGSDIVDFSSPVINLL
jgi:hypothetical protein